MFLRALRPSFAAFQKCMDLLYGFPESAFVTVLNLGVVRRAFRYLEYLNVSFGIFLLTYDPNASLSRTYPDPPHCGNYFSSLLEFSSFSTCFTPSVRHLQRRTAASWIWISSPLMTTACL